MIQTRIVNGFPIANYKDEWLLENNNNIINGLLVSEWDLAPLYDGDFVKPFFNGTEWIESETTENIYVIKSGVYKETN